MMNLAGNSTDMSVLERQQVRMKWQQEQLQQQSYFDGNEFNVYSVPAQAQFESLVNCDPVLNQFMNQAVKVDPGLENGWQDFGKLGGDVSGFGSCGFVNGSEFEMNNYAIPMTATATATASCSPAMTTAKVEVGVADTKGRESVLPGKLSSATAKGSFKKRKADETQNPKVVAEAETRNKRIKGCAHDEGESKITEQSITNNNNNNRETSTDTSKENSKVSEVQKPDYIHVRARRGQATDSHSLAERVRREKISERMKYLQDLVPGCNKITGKAGMLDEIINYVQSLQRQVEFLSMKLAAMNPRLDFNIDNLFAKEVFPTCGSNFPTIGVSSDMTNPAYLQFNQMQQLVSCCGMDLGVTPPDMALKRTLSAPLSIPETFLDSSCFNQIQHSSTWDADLQNLYGAEFHQGRTTSLSPQQFIGSIEASNLKTEM